jgi:HEAT repeat protein
MQPTLLAAFVLLALPAPPVRAASAAAPSGLQEEGQEVPDKRPEIKELIEELQAHYKKKGKEDEEAIAVMDKLTQEFERSGPKDKESIVAGLADAFDEKRPKEIVEGVPDTRIYDAAAVTLGTMGPESVPALVKLVDHKNLKKLLATRGRLIQSLGKTKDLAGVKPLRELLKDKDVEIVAAAAQAIGYYEEAPQPDRKEAFEDLLKTLMSAKGSMDSDPQDLIARERYQAIAASIITTLGALTGHDEREPEAWQRWWNKNKKADWDELEN